MLRRVSNMILDTHLDVLHANGLSGVKVVEFQVRLSATLVNTK